MNTLTRISRHMRAFILLEGGRLLQRQNDYHIMDEQKTRSRHSRRSSKVSLPIGTVVMGKYELKEKIGSGGYGDIFRANCRERDTEVAVKVLRDNSNVIGAKRFVLEQQIYKELTGEQSFPHMFGCGTHNGKMFISMEFLGRSLSDLKRKGQNRRLNPVTAIRCGIQMLNALQTLHKRGIVHRDIKPDNMCISAGSEKKKTVFLIDFGLARRFRANGKLIRRNRSAGFRGTHRYVSLNVHENKDHTPVDDIISLFYSIIELSEGTLPWSKLRVSKDIAFKKKMTKWTEMCRTQPEILYEFYEYSYETCEDMNFPMYDHLLDILKKCLPSNYDDSLPLSFDSRRPSNDGVTVEASVVEVADAEAISPTE